MAVNTSAVSDPLYTTVVIDTDANTTLESFNNVATTVYQIEIINPNSSAVWVRINWAASGGNTTTQNDNIFYCPGTNNCYYVFGSGYAITGGVQVWCSTEKGLGGGNITLNSPTSKVIVRMALKDT
tara:strand:+ start:7349 stop:7726 length:378 start_codon:yes stop_codon:yes gene_type:complete